MAAALPVGVARSCSRSSTLDVVLAVAVIAFALALGAMALFGEDLLGGGDWF